MNLRRVITLVHARVNEMRSYYNPTTFHDLLMNSLLGFIMLFIIALLLINPAKKDAEIKKPPAEYMITITWPHGYESDVDIWVEDPIGNKLFFRQKDIGLMHLDRDDLGDANDVVWVNGQRITFDYNHEIVTIRGFISGEWIVNIHMYNKKDNGPVPVIVKMDKLNPTVVTVVNKTIILKTNWQEVTVARFQMSNDGEILQWDNTFKKIIEDSGVGVITNFTE